MTSYAPDVTEIPASRIHTNMLQYPVAEASQHTAIPVSSSRYVLCLPFFIVKEWGLCHYHLRLWTCETTKGVKRAG
jgi:hypothetical protein